MHVQLKLKLKQLAINTIHAKTWKKKAATFTGQGK